MNSPATPQPNTQPHFSPPSRTPSPTAKQSSPTHANGNAPRLDSIGEEPTNFFYSSMNHRDSNYNYMLQNGLFPIIPSKPGESPTGMSTPSVDGPLSPPLRRANGAPRPQLTIVPPSTPLIGNGNVNVAGYDICILFFIISHIIFDLRKPKPHKF